HKSASLFYSGDWFINSLAMNVLAVMKPMGFFGNRLTLPLIREEAVWTAVRCRACCNHAEVGL
ncbi:hypothetical protein, partial [Bacteroides heparinolyticus]|uniref:hypothetical protein n=1 Tax=Prevotella heparinolytica TaxID=28113 RepID=UPI00359F503E